MLSKEDVEYLVQQGVFQPVDKDLREKDHWGRPCFTIREGKDAKYYYFSRIENDDLCLKYIDEHIEELSSRTHWIMENQIESEEKLRLPHPGMRLKILEEHFNKSVKLLKSNLDDLELSGLDITTIKRNLTILYKFQLDKIFTLDPETKLPVFDVSYSTFREDPDMYEELTRDNRTLSQLKEIEWLRSEIVEENQKLNANASVQLIGNIDEVKNNGVAENNFKKLEWSGTPSQFGFIIDLLIQGGYLKKPTSSFEKDAAQFLKIFNIATTPNTLAKELSEQTNSLDTKNRKKFQLPPKTDLIS